MAFMGQRLWLRWWSGRGSNPVIGKKLYSSFTFNCTEKTKIKEMAHF